MRYWKITTDHTISENERAEIVQQWQKAYSSGEMPMYIGNAKINLPQN